ncbi:unnamed protein product [Mytilus coruscus]|uniref:C2H2-type domain-containing protein n=1 Tax=Mytilus coruscus TaxID=42192 RepID=A0A6J8EDF4_MYTCO|nr:unnamed protein product [Mytilus coruscus]
MHKYMYTKITQLKLQDIYLLRVLLLNLTVQVFFVTTDCTPQASSLKRKGYKKTTRKQTSKTKGRQGKRGRGRKLKQTTPLSDSSDENCGICGKPEKSEEDWICCDICSIWYHRDCVGLEDETSWLTETTIDDIEEPDATKYINLLKDKIVIDQFPLKIKIIITSEFATPIAFDRIESHYSHPAKVVLTQNNLSKFYDDLIDKFKAWVDQFQERGSGFDFNSIKSVQVKLYKYEYQRASSYIPLQFKSKNIINVQNKNDNKCFLWSILAYLYPVVKNKQRVTNYKEYEDEISMKGIEYPVAKEDIPKVEKQNNLIINVFALKDQTNKQTLYPIYVSNKESEKCYVVDLLYIENNGNAHYCLIKDLDSFMCDNNGHKQFTCRNCIQGFQREETLEKHKKICYDYEPCRTIMPEPGKNILEFNNHHFKNRLPFVIYCDFEACNIPMQSCTPDPDKSYTKPISKQK